VNAVVRKVGGKAKRIIQVLSGKTNLNRNIVNFQTKNNSKRPNRPINFEKQIEIIIPCYNHAKYLKQTFDSILAQTWKKYPITVTFIDDNSTDETQGVIKEIKKNVPKYITVKAIKNSKNLRQHGSLNKAIAHSNNSLIIILNDDDLLVPDCIEKVIETFKTNKDVFMVGGSSIWFESKLPNHKITPYKSIKSKIFTPELAATFKEFNDINMTHSSTSFFKSAWQAVGGYREKNRRLHIDLNEDRDFQMRVAALFPVAVLDYPLAYWRTNSSHGKDF
jgi:glycosyltransferase involved in cell wall biosynthesis